MRWRICGGLLIMLCTGLIAYGQGRIDYTVKAPLQSVTPVADGTIGAGEYSNSLFLSYVDRQNPGNPFSGLDHMCKGPGGATSPYCDLDTESPTAFGDADLSATMYLGHTDEFLFLGFDVTDGWLEYDTIGAASFQNDAVELYMDPDADGAEGTPGFNDEFRGGECFHIWADASNGSGDNGIDGGATTVEDIEFNNRAGDAAYPAFGYFYPPQPGEIYSAGLVHSATNYVIEFQIPLATLDTLDGDETMPAKTGDTLRFTAVIDDNDRPGGTQDTYAELWYIEGETRSNWGTEENWVVGLELSEAEPSLPGDFNDNGAYDTGDIDILTAQSASNQNNKPYDLNNDNLVNAADVTVWAKDLADTWIGDANYDRVFDSNDFVSVFVKGKYELPVDAVWTDGDWDGNGRFDSTDFVAAFVDGGYELGLPPAAASAVPEPASCILALLAAVACLVVHRRN